MMDVAHIGACLAILTAVSPGALAQSGAILVGTGYGFSLPRAAPGQIVLWQAARSAVGPRRIRACGAPQFAHLPYMIAVGGAGSSGSPAFLKGLLIM